MASSMWAKASTACGRACVQAPSHHGFAAISATHAHRASATLPLYSLHVRQNSAVADAKLAQEREVTKNIRSRSDQLLSPSSFPEEGKADIERIMPERKSPKVVLDSGAPAEPLGMSKTDIREGALFSSLKGSIHYDTLKALTTKPFNLTHMSPVQAEVLPLLPQIAEPYSAEPPADGSSRPPRDLLVKARTGTGKTLGFLVPAIEARLNAIEAFGKQAVKDAGLTSDKHMEGRARRVFTREHVGTLIISPTRELATQIANEALRLAHHHKDFEVRLFVGGSSKRLQMRDWMKGRRDVVVATPGRLRDLLISEPEIVRGISKTKTLILDEADTLLEMGFREDIDAIAEYLPKTPERQTFLFSATVSRSIQQVARAILDKNHLFINTVSESGSPVHANIPQYHTVLPSAKEQMPHVLRLLAHDQLTSPGKSKAIVFLPTTKMTQLYATFIRELSKTVLPSAKKTKVYEIHSKRTQEARTMTSDAFRSDVSGAAILVSSDVSARGVDYPGVSRVIQIGIPGSTDQYVHRIGRTGRAGTHGRGDLVLLPWECGFVTWQLTEMPLRPLTVSELKSQVKDLATKYDEDPQSFFQGVKASTDAAPRFDRGGRVSNSGPFMYNVPVSPSIENMGNTIAELLEKLDEEAVQETFASLLGYYIAKSPELRVQKNIIVQGCKDWTTESCGLPVAPYVSDAFLQRLGFSDGRTKRFGAAISEYRKPDRGGPSWMGRGLQRNKGKERDAPDWAASEIDEHDPIGRPEEYRSYRYGKMPNTYDDEPPRRQQEFGSDYGNRGSYGNRGRGSASGRDGGGGFGRRDRFGRRDAGESGYGVRQ